MTGVSRTQFINCPLTIIFKATIIVISQQSARLQSLCPKKPKHLCLNF